MSSLPQIDVPLYEVTLPSSGKKVTYRPFTMKEKKLFLLVRETAEISDVVSTIKQVINNCIVSPKLEVDDIPIIDLEMFFVHMRARSMGEIQNLDFECLNNVNGAKCGGVAKLSFNLLDATVERNPEHTNKIEITDKIGIVMKYPTFAMAKMLDMKADDPDILLNAIADSIDYIYDAESLHYPKDRPRAELLEWLEKLGQNTFRQIDLFFETSPKIIGHSTFLCPKCSYTEDVKLSGISDFFG